MTESDAALVRQSLNGERRAFEELVRRHASKIGAVVWSRLRGRGPVEDLVQETFLRGYRHLVELETPDRFRPWLHGIAVRACQDWLKARARSEVSLDVMTEKGIPGLCALNPDDPNEEDDRRTRLHSELAALPEPYRETILLFYQGGRSYREIATMLSVSEATVNSRLTKARAKLRERLGVEAR